MTASATVIRVHDLLLNGWRPEELEGVAGQEDALIDDMLAAGFMRKDAGGVVGAEDPVPAEIPVAPLD